MAENVSNKIKKFSEDYQNCLLNKTRLSDDEKSELRWRLLSYRIFVFFVLLIGLPVWYFTTTPYRASLPYFDDEFYDKIKDLFGKSSSLLPSNDAKRLDVWSQVTIFPTYQIHLVFVHEADQRSDFLQELNSTHTRTQWIIDGVKKYAALFDDIVQLRTSAEHLFDFSLDSFLTDHLVKEDLTEYLHLDDNLSGYKKWLVIDKTKISALTTEIDRWSTQPVGSNPLIKIAIFYSNRVQFLDDQGEVKGLAVASWGGLLADANNSKTVLNAIFAVLKIQLGIDAEETMSKSAVYNIPVNKVLQEMENHKMQLTMENLLQTIHFINSLHGLKDKIEDLVISDEVAQLAYTAYQNFYVSYNALIKEGRTDARSSAYARILAEKAVTHYSLLEFLNFPADQKYGIYVPLFFPLLYPVIQPLFWLILYLFKSKREVLPFDYEKPEKLEEE